MEHLKDKRIRYCNKIKFLEAACFSGAYHGFGWTESNPEREHELLNFDARCDKIRNRYLFWKKFRYCQDIATVQIQLTDPDM